MHFQDATRAMRAMRAHLQSLVFGQEDLIDEVVSCLAANGHLLMTGAPGLAKTTLVRALSEMVGVPFKRIQFTPDLLPSDITGADVLDIDPETGKREFRFVPGPVFGGLLLADEINRASPRTQSALLEAMQERSVTIGGVTHALPRPFLVFATQNPFESEGVFALPEAQLDRFLLHSLVNYPSADAELTMLTEHAAGTLVGEKKPGDAPPSDAKPALTIDASTLEGVMGCAQRVRIDPALLQGIVSLVRLTRPESAKAGVDSPAFVQQGVVYGAGPRSGLALVSAARAFALLEESETLHWRHVERMVKPVLRHRIRLSMAAVRDGLSEDSVVDMLVQHAREQLKLDFLES